MASILLYNLIVQLKRVFEGIDFNFIVIFFEIQSREASFLAACRFSMRGEFFMRILAQQIALLKEYL